MVEFSNGIILQYRKGHSNSYTWTFPISFPTACKYIPMIDGSNLFSQEYVLIQSSITVICRSVDCSGSYYGTIALDY